ncbi:hypothetical protein BDZ45DRAFT_688418 [Acephala macrosclerotiorum]|nr:hypothetical protein BDZ45DRAFT_688418 [Acephala macrosclerotiorum]
MTAQQDTQANRDPGPHQMRSTSSKVEFSDHTANETFVRYSRVPLTAIGFLDTPNSAESIANIREFRGRIFHSSGWDHEVDFEGKDAVVVGNGASANQSVPWLLENNELRNLVQVALIAQWIAPKENQKIGKGFEKYPIHKSTISLIASMKFNLAFVAFTNSFLGRHVRSRLVRHPHNVRELYEQIEDEAIYVIFGKFEDLLYFNSFDSREPTLIRVRSLQLSIVLGSSSGSAAANPPEIAALQRVTASGTKPQVLPSQRPKPFFADIIQLHVITSGTLNKAADS